jgi:hypothetical protein
LYYRKAGTDLDAALRPIAGDAQKSLQAVSILGRVLEQSGTGKLTYDAAGNLTGLVVTGTGRAAGSSHVVGVGKATYSPPPQYDRQHEQPLPDEKGNPHA